MGFSLDIITYVIAGILFLGAGILALRLLRILGKYWPWTALGGAWFLLAAAAGVQISRLMQQPPDLIDLWPALLALAAGALACFGTFLTGERLVRDWKARLELERYRSGFDQEVQIAVIKDRQGTYIAANLAFARFLGKKQADLAGETDFNFFPRSQAGIFRTKEESVIESGRASTAEEELHGVAGPCWFRITRTPLLDDKNTVIGLLVSGEEIVAEKQAEAALAEWRRGLVALLEAEIALGEVTDPTAAGESILTWAGEITGALHAGLWQVLPELSTLILKSGTGQLSRLAGVLQLKAGEDIVWKAWQSGQVMQVDDYQNWPEAGDWARQSGLCAALGLPLKARGQAAWVLTLFHDQPGLAFRDEHIQLLSLFAQLASSRLSSTERLAGSQHELDARQEALSKLQYRMRLEHVLAVIASHFINLDLEKVDEAITRSLQTFSRFAQVERCHLVLFPRQGPGAAEQSTFYTSENGAVSAAAAVGPGVYDDPAFQWYLGKLNQLETIHIPRPTGLPSDAEEAAAFLRTHKIQSFTAIPLLSNRSLIGYLTYAALRNEVEWSQDVLTLLKVSAEMFVNLLERVWAGRENRERQEKTRRQIEMLEQRNREGVLIAEMGDLLQACRTSDEAYPIITRYIQRILPTGSGALYSIHDPKDPAEKVAAWGLQPPAAIEQELVSNECWSLRRGRMYVVADPTAESLCGHIKEELHGGYMCVPMIAQGLAVGVLHLRLGVADPATSYSDDEQRLAVRMAEYIAMPLNNLKLRDELRSQAIRDPLTGLFNRRYMEETLEREIRRANRHSTSVGIIMFDIDRMKPINDRYGHDAGDLLLKSLGRELQRLFRGEDVACRFGGDEFMVVLPEAPLADVWRRAEDLRSAIRRLDLVYEGKPLGAITLSIGVAAYPDHGQTAERVLQACDAASYNSKSEGGDRIMMGHKTEA